MLWTHQWSQSIMLIFTSNFSETFPSAVVLGSSHRESYITSSRLRLSLACKNIQAILWKHLKQQQAFNRIPYPVLTNITQCPPVFTDVTKDFSTSDIDCKKQWSVNQNSKNRGKLQYDTFTAWKDQRKAKKLQAQFLTRFLIVLLMKRPCCNHEVAYCTDIDSTSLLNFDIRT